MQKTLNIPIDDPDYSNIWHEFKNLFASNILIPVFCFSHNEQLENQTSNAFILYSEQTIVHHAHEFACQSNFHEDL
jgi:hypothetical protein